MFSPFFYSLHTQHSKRSILYYLVSFPIVCASVSCNSTGHWYVFISLFLSYLIFMMWHKSVTTWNPVSCMLDDLITPYVIVFPGEGEIFALLRRRGGPRNIVGWLVKTWDSPSLASGGLPTSHSWLGRSVARQLWDTASIYDFKSRRATFDIIMYRVVIRNCKVLGSCPIHSKK